MKNKKISFILLSFLILALFVSNIAIGSVKIPLSGMLDILLSGGKGVKDSWRYIVLESRIPQAVTAVLAGASLSVCGLMLQALFRNPLADPSILGISGGANLGVAIVLLYMGGSLGGRALIINLSVVFSAIAGALLILGIVVWFSAKLNNQVLILIIGLIISYLTSSFITILNSIASKDNIYSFVMWGMGSFGNVTSSMLFPYSAALVVLLFCSVLMIKSLNLFQIGEGYAYNLGLNIKKTRNRIILLSGVLTAVVTAFCGPISFIGLMVPHLAFFMCGTSNQQILLPVTLLCGAALALFCNLFSVIPMGENLIPINAVTPILGTPVILYVILKRKIY